MRAGILRLGRDQLAETGAAGLSVREIARGLGVASSAIYRHVANRDALLTLLVVDAYTELAEAAEAADTAAEPDERLRQLATSVRAWGTANPASWSLIYGSPVPGYAAPADETTPAGTRVMLQFLFILVRGDPAARRSPRPPVSDGLAQTLGAGITELAGQEATVGAALAAEALAVPGFAADAVEAWTALIGLVSAEIFGQLGPELSVFGEEILGRWIAATAQRFGLSSPSR